MLEEFKKFALRGNVMDMAVGFIMGAAFGAIVKSLVSDVVMPPIGLLIGNVDFANLFVILKSGTLAGPYGSLAEAQKAGAVTINYGLFLNTIISFIIIALSVFFLIRGINKLKWQEQAQPTEPTKKECPYCFSSIAIKATRCAYCTSELKE